MGNVRECALIKDNNADRSPMLRSACLQSGVSPTLRRTPDCALDGYHKVDGCHSTSKLSPVVLVVESWMLPSLVMLASL